MTFDLSPLKSNQFNFEFTWIGAKYVGIPSDASCMIAFKWDEVIDSKVYFISMFYF